jgi:mannose-6-phosphate isomerase-like protein (cupin superfamily)
MRLEKSDAAEKGWMVGAWNSPLPLSIGYANKGLDEPHLHLQMTEIFLVARGSAEILIEQTTLELQAGDVLIIEPGEAHTFVSSSPDYFHFVIHTPGLKGEEVQLDKLSVLRSRFKRV